VKVNHAVTTFMTPWAGAGAATYAAADALTASTALTDINVKTSVGIAGGTVVVTVMKNDVATGLTCTVAVSTTTCSGSTSVTFAGGDSISVRVVNNSPTAGQDPNVQWSLG
jgi:hypothetical protein